MCVELRIWPRTLPWHFTRDGTRSFLRCQDPTFGRGRASGGGQWGHREQVRELLAPDDRAGEIGGVGAGGQRVPEGTVRGLEPAELERPRRVVVDGRRQVDVEVRAVADGEVLEPEDVRAGCRLDDRGRAAAEVEVVGAVERSGGDPARGERRRDRRRCLGCDRRWRSGRSAADARGRCVRRRDGRDGRDCRCGRDRAGLDERRPDPDRRGQVIAESAGPRSGRRPGDSRHGTGGVARRGTSRHAMRRRIPTTAAAPTAMAPHRYAGAVLRTQTLRTIWVSATLGVTGLGFAAAIAFSSGHEHHAHTQYHLPAVRASSMHVASTAWFASVKDVRAHLREQPKRYVFAPLAAVVVAASVAAATTENQFISLLLAFYAWQFFRFQKQNFGLTALAATAHRALSMTKPERISITVLGLIGIAGLLAHPQLLKVTGASDWLNPMFPLAAAAYAIATIVAVAAFFAPGPLPVTAHHVDRYVCGVRAVLRAGLRVRFAVCGRRRARPRPRAAVPVDRRPRGLRRTRRHAADGRPRHPSQRGAVRRTPRCATCTATPVTLRSRALRRVPRRHDGALRLRRRNLAAPRPVLPSVPQRYPSSAPTCSPAGMSRDRPFRIYHALAVLLNQLLRT